MSGNVRRVRLYKYEKSGKLAAIFAHGGHIGYCVVELSPDMQTITNTRNPKYIKRDALSPTQYWVEMVEKNEGKEGDHTLFSYRLLRVLSPEDLNEDRWMSTVSLDELPVSPEPSLTREEELWAGKREGNLVGGIILAAITFGTIIFAVQGYLEHSGYVFPGLIAAVAGFVLLKYPWKVPKSPRPAKLQELIVHKEALRQKVTNEYTAARTEFEKVLEDYRTWEELSPKDFELALSLRLQNEGYEVETTQFSKDGGIDIEAKDKEGIPVIVQAKQYSTNVGVAVVREMVGIRESRPDKPRTIIYSLVGFTRGAKQLAEQDGVELRDIKSEVLGF